MAASAARLHPASGAAPGSDALLARAPAGLRTFFRIATAWDLGAEDQRVLLGRPARSTFYRWRKGETGGVTPDTMERLSHLFGIYGALHAIFLDGATADGWVRRPNTAPPFDGVSALEVMLRGRVADLYQVRRYLEAVAEGGR